MARNLNPLPVTSGMVETCRDFRAWLEPLDEIRPDDLKGLMTSDAHWFAFVRRADLPIEVAARTPVEPASAPGDVMMLVKRHMSDHNLAQEPLKFLRAGASCVLPCPRGPSKWEPRHPLTDEETRGFERLCRKVLDTLPSRAGAVGYIQDWMRKPRAPPQAPPPLQLLTHRCRRDSAAIGLVLEDALAGGHVASEPRLVTLKRRRHPEGARLQLPLGQYVNFRVSQGVSADDAVQEWQGGQHWPTGRGG